MKEKARGVLLALLKCLFCLLSGRKRGRRHEED